MGKVHKTRMDEDFNALQTETEAKRAALEKLNESSQAYLKAISKRVEGEDKYKGLAIETFGMSMSSQAHAIREGSGYREALLQMGEAHQAIGTAQVELIGRFNSSYIECLEREQAQMKEYQALSKKLHSRRLDYDAKLAKVQKAKKEKPEWEEEMQAAKAKYEDTRECLLGVMTAINDSQDENVHSLKIYYDAQLAYARKMVEALEAIPESTFVCASPNGSHNSSFQVLHRTCRRDSYEREEDRQSTYSDDQNSVHSGSTGRHPLDRASSVSDLRRHSTINNQPQTSDLGRSTSHSVGYGRGPVRKGSVGFSRSNGVTVAIAAPTAAPSSALPARARQQKQVRALYNFEATGEGELSLQKGDVVNIIEEIDEGWWEGEMVDAHGVRHEGMFPSNYVEEVLSDAGSHRRKSSLNSITSEPSRYADEEEAAYYQRETEPIISHEEPKTPEPEAAAHIHAPSAKRAPPPPVRQSNVANGHTAAHSNETGARATPPPSRPASGMVSSSKPIGCRAAPPPPGPRRAPVVPALETMRQSGVSHHQPSSPLGGGTSSPSALAVSTPGASGMGYIPKDYFVNQAAGGGGAAAEAAVGPCRECQCTEFSPNVFKRGSCNNCFHTH
ncbi:hypothetical protein EDD11_009533 [Mortierella claussenii]|nr:hypothetical protein EDD11_009533 [Mortierella claussenii]